MFLTNLQKEILEKKGFDLNNDIEIQKFLSPRWERDLFDYKKLKDINKSVERIKKAIDNEENIIIYADYDFTLCVATDHGALGTLFEPYAGIYGR